MTRIIQFSCALGFIVTLAVLSVLILAPPGTDLGVFAQSPDPRLGHFLAFFFMTPLAAAGFPGLRLRWIILLLLFLGAGLELGQTFTGREVSAADLAANLGGVAAGLYPQLALHLRGRAQALRRQDKGGR